MAGEEQGVWKAPSRCFPSEQLPEKSKPAEERSSGPPLNSHQGSEKHADRQEFTAAVSAGVRTACGGHGGERGRARSRGGFHPPRVKHSEGENHEQEMGNSSGKASPTQCLLTSHSEAAS